MSNVRSMKESPQMMMPSTSDMCHGNPQDHNNDFYLITIQNINLHLGFCHLQLFKGVVRSLSNLERNTIVYIFMNLCLICMVDAK